MGLKRTTNLALPLLVLVLLAVACSSGGDDDGPRPADATASTGASGGAPCTPRRPHATGDTSATLSSGGIERTYILHVPPSYDGTRAVPLVVNLHGFGSNAAQQAAYSRFPAKADAEGFIVVTPDGTGQPRRWNNIQVPGAPDDVGFIAELLDVVESGLCIDDARVYAAGMSNGAAFAQRLGCSLPGRFAAVAAVTALVFPLRCEPGPVPVIGFHGTEDPCVPFEGGQTQCGLMLPVPAIETSALNWAKHNGCATAPVRSQETEHVRSVAYGECDSSADVALYVVDGGGHTWPGSFGPARLGPTTREIDATALIWDFFAGHAATR